MTSAPLLAFPLSLQKLVFLLMLCWAEWEETVNPWLLAVSKGVSLYCSQPLHFCNSTGILRAATQASKPEHDRRVRKVTHTHTIVSMCCVLDCSELTTHMHCTSGKYRDEGRVLEEHKVETETFF